MLVILVMWVEILFLVSLVSVFVFSIDDDSLMDRIGIFVGLKCRMCGLLVLLGSVFCICDIWLCIFCVVVMLLILRLNMISIIDVLVCVVEVMVLMFDRVVMVFLMGLMMLFFIVLGVVLGYEVMMVMIGKFILGNLLMVRWE